MKPNMCGLYGRLAQWLHAHSMHTSKAHRTGAADYRQEKCFRTLCLYNQCETTGDQEVANVTSALVACSVQMGAAVQTAFLIAASATSHLCQFDYALDEAMKMGQCEHPGCAELWLAVRGC